MASKLELWGGHECTVNRVGDAYSDQTRLSGHEDRIGDLDLFAALGCRTLRYPVLWERVSPDDPEIRNWAWSDARLARLRALGVAPIVGLVHHGAGPAYTGLVEPSFAAGLAEHARATAERYPWVEAWTPVNEPLTTARFSALYGHWHPHATSQAAFWIALLNQIDGVRLSMAAIRRVNPQARLIQTEDLGRAYGTTRLADQVDFDNRRRWLSWDLLTGRVDEHHPLFGHIAGFGLGERLKAIAQDPCPPDVIGVNHYLTSDRFLDERIERYPSHTHGGNGRDRYADVEAIRVLTPGPDGLEGVLREAHARYGLPLAVTEVHNGCTREEQMRWLLEAWRTAQRLRGDGVDVRAVTAWSLLGAYGWDDLLRKPGGRYEPGVFDLRGGAPRATGVARLMRALSAGEPAPAVAEGAGWWRCDTRLEHQPVDRRDIAHAPGGRAEHPAASRPMLIVGEGRQLAQAFTEACRRRGLGCAWRPDPDLGSALAPLPCGASPWAVVFVGDQAALDQGLALAQACADQAAPLLIVSIGLGARLASGESAAGAETRAAFERQALALWPCALIVRAPALEADNDADALELAHQALDLLADGEVGPWRVDGGALPPRAPPALAVDAPPMGRAIDDAPQGPARPPAPPAVAARVAENLAPPRGGP